MSYLYHVRKTAARFGSALQITARQLTDCGNSTTRIPYLELDGDGSAMPRHVGDIRHKLCCMQALVAVGLRLHDVVFET